MAGSGDKTERATPRKRRDESRKRGQVARSREINTGLGLLAIFAMLSFAGGWMLAGMTAIMGTTLGALRRLRPDHRLVGLARPDRRRVGRRCA